jgi:hypothetical protein
MINCGQLPLFDECQCAGCGSGLSPPQLQNMANGHEPWHMATELGVRHLNIQFKQVWLAACSFSCKRLTNHASMNARAQYKQHICMDHLKGLMQCGHDAGDVCACSGWKGDITPLPGVMPRFSTKGEVRMGILQAFSPHPVSLIRSSREFPPWIPVIVSSCVCLDDMFQPDDTWAHSLVTSADNTGASLGLGVCCSCRDTHSLVRSFVRFFSVLRGSLMYVCVPGPR